MLEENLQPEAGARTDAAAFVVLLTDGKSQDDAVAAAAQLKAAGVEIVAVGGEPGSNTSCVASLGC